MLFWAVSSTVIHALDDEDDVLAEEEDEAAIF